MALHHAVQTAAYLQEFQKNYMNTWQTQVHTDQEILGEIQQKIP
jgi:hypothetical protein